MKKTHKLLILLALVCTLLVCGMMSASAETEGIFIYTVTDGEAKITGIDDTFAGDLIIPDTLGGYTVTSIGGDALGSTTSIDSVYIGKNITTLDRYALYCYALKEINVDEANPYFCNDENGVLFDKDKTVLIQYPFGSKTEEYVVPSTVKEIGFESLTNVPFLEKLILPDGLETISKNAIAEYISIEELVIPDTVTRIEDGALWGTMMVREITIPASVEYIGEASLGAVYYWGHDKIYIEGMNTVLDGSYVGLMFCTQDIVTREEYKEVYRLVFKSENEPNSVTEEELKIIEETQLLFEQGITYHDTPIPAGTIYCHAGSTAETYAIENGIDYELTHFYKGEWSYDYENMIRIRKCIHCDVLETEALEKAEDTETEIEIIVPADPDTNFVVDEVGETSDNYVIIEEALTENTEGSFEIIKAFDITMTGKDGVHVQPDGTVKVKLPIEAGKDGEFKVYRVNDDGTITDMKAYKEGSHLVFVTDHFSLYVIVDTSEPHTHKYNEVITKPATHMEEGIKTFTCSGCGDTYTEAIAKDSQHHAELKHKSATCTEDGYKRAVCECGFVMLDEFYEKLGHLYSYEVTVWPTHTREGSEIADCIRCDDTFVETMPKLPDHDYNYYVKTFDPTCTEQGYTLHKCSCGDSYKDRYTDPAGHTRSQSGDWCSVCGVDMDPVEPDTSNCSCNCHKSGFMGFIYKIQRFFWKIFKTNKICACGVAHY